MVWYAKGAPPSALTCTGSVPAGSSLFATAFLAASSASTACKGGAGGAGIGKEWVDKTLQWAVNSATEYCNEAVSEQ